MCVQKIHEASTQEITVICFITHRLNFGGLRLQLGLFNGCFSLNLGSLCTGLCLCLGLSSRLHCSTVGLEFEELLAGSLCFGLVCYLLTFQSTLCLLFQTLSFVSRKIKREL